jgi:hypothetical protein
MIDSFFSLHTDTPLHSRWNKGEKKFHGHSGIEIFVPCIDTLAKKSLFFVNSWKFNPILKLGFV